GLTCPGSPRSRERSTQAATATSHSCFARPPPSCRPTATRLKNATAFAEGETRDAGRTLCWANDASVQSLQAPAAHAGDACRCAVRCPRLGVRDEVGRLSSHRQRRQAARHAL